MRARLGDAVVVGVLWAVAGLVLCSVLAALAALAVAVAGTL